MQRLGQEVLAEVACRWGRDREIQKRAGLGLWLLGSSAAGRDEKAGRQSHRPSDQANKQVAASQGRNEWPVKTKRRVFEAEYFLLRVDGFPREWAVAFVEMSGALAATKLRQ